MGKVNRLARTMMRRWKIWTAALLLLAAFPVTAWSAEMYERDLLAEIRYILKEYHLSNISEDELMEAAIEGMLSTIGDPYTDYMNAEEWQQYQDSFEQTYVGVGIRLGQDEFGVYAVDVFSGSPAYEAGILRGDYIVEVNGQSALGKTTEEIVSMIAGAENTKVELTVLRDGDRKTYTLSRRSLSIPNVEYSWLPNGYGYIKINTFSLGADEQFSEYMMKMKTAGLNGLVIDVRGNPGGYLETVAYIAGEFLENGVLIHTRDKNGRDNPVTILNGYSVDAPVVILIDENSASGSEILAGALQDHRLAKVVGVRSFGKGSVQSVFLLSNGGVLKTTTQEYLTPNGHRVNGNGIEPDIEVKGRAAQLLTAFREVGMKPLTVTTNRREMVVNGVSFGEPLPFVEQDGRVFVHSRVLGALAGLRVEWDGELRSVVMTRGDERILFAVDSADVMNRNGMAMIELDSFSKLIPEFSWNYTDGKLTMSVR